MVIKKSENYIAKQGWNRLQVLKNYSIRGPGVLEPHLSTPLGAWDTTADNILFLQRSNTTRFIIVVLFMVRIM